MGNGDSSDYTSPTNDRHKMHGIPGVGGEVGATGVDIARVSWAVHDISRFESRAGKIK